MNSLSKNKKEFWLKAIKIYIDVMNTNRIQEVIQAYQKSDYEKAQILAQTILDSGEESPVLYLSLIHI